MENASSKGSPLTAASSRAPLCGRLRRRIAATSTDGERLPAEAPARQRVERRPVLAAASRPARRLVGPLGGSAGGEGNVECRRKIEGEAEILVGEIDHETGREVALE